MTKPKATGNFEPWQNVAKYYLQVSAPKTPYPGATSAPCTCELPRKPLPSRKRNRRSQAVAISVTPGWDDVFLNVDPERGIKAGERWAEALEAAGSWCEAFLFLISGSWLARSRVPAKR